MAKIKSMRPIPYQLSQYGSGTEILYKCANCGADFRILGRQHDFCHKCGTKQNWEISPQYCSPEFKEEYDFLRYMWCSCIDRSCEFDEKIKRLFFSLYKGEIK